MRLLTTLMLSAFLLSAQTRTTLKGVLNSPGTGLRVSCAVAVTLSGVTTSVVVAGGSELAPTKYSSMLTGGSYSFQLVPNDVITPSGTYYSATFGQCDTGESWTEVWVVPTSATPLTISAVRASVPTSPSMAVSPAQLTSGGGTAGQGLVWNGTSYAPTTLSGSGTVTSVACGTSGVSWLTCSFGASPTTTPALVLGAATGQTSHQVIGTCGAATSFAPCALQASDIPSLAYAPWPSGSTAGVPFYSGSGAWSSVLPVTTTGAQNSLLKTDVTGALSLYSLMLLGNSLSSPAQTGAGPYSGVAPWVFSPGLVGNGTDSHLAAGGLVLIQGGNEATNNIASRGGNLMLESGANLGLSGVPGLLDFGQDFMTSGSPNQYQMLCLTGSRTASQCSASPASVLGVNDDQVAGDVVAMLPGSTSLAFSSNAATVGHTVCLGAASPKVTDSGGVTPCGMGQGFTVGQVVAISGVVDLPDSSVASASSTLPLIQWWKFWSEGKGDLPSTMAATDQSNTYAAGTTQSSAAVAHSIPAKVGAVGAIPSTCTVGELYFATDATAGQQIYECSATSTWTQQSGGSQLAIYATGASVGTRPVLDFWAGSGILQTVSDTGTKVTVITAVDTAQVLTPGVAQSGAPIYCKSASGSTTVYTCLLSPTLSGVYQEGMVLDWVPDLTGAGGATTLNVDTLGAKSVKQADCSTDPSATDIVAGTMRQVAYNGSLFCFVGPLPSSGGGGGSAPVFAAYASRGACTSGNVGQMFFAAEVSNKRWICDGSTWQPVAFDMQVVEPTTLSWTPSGYSTVPSVASVAGTIAVTASVSGGLQVAATPISLSTPYTIEIAFTFSAMQSGCGLVLFSSAPPTISGQTWWAWFIGSSADQGAFLPASNLSFFDQWGDNMFSYRGQIVMPVIREKLVDDGTNRTFYLNNGAGYFQVFQQSDAADNTPHLPGYWGVGCSIGGSQEAQLVLYSASVHH